jgi:hypothetical protein
MDKKMIPATSPSRRLCPVCKKAVYSRGGIHPQCAMAQAEPPKPKKPTPVSTEGASPV